MDMFIIKIEDNLTYLHAYIMDYSNWFNKRERGWMNERMADWDNIARSRMGNKKQQDMLEGDAMKWFRL